METKQIQVDCPCCSSKLTIDVLTQTVMRADLQQDLDEMGKPRVPGKQWDVAVGRVEERSSGAGDRLDSALDAERGKVDRLDDLFDKANAKLKRRDEEREDLDM
jgi:hypothetical protein